MTDDPIAEDPKDNEINDMWDPRDDDDLLEVGRALGYDDRREPPTERVAEVRRAAAQLRDEQASAAGGVTDFSTARTRGSRRTLLVGLAAATVGALGGGVVGSALGGGDGGNDTAVVPTEALTLTGIPAGVSASGRLINHTWGTEVLLDVKDLPPGTVYRVGLETTKGSTDAGSFLSVADVLMVCRFNAAPLRADVRAVVVRDPNDKQVMRADLT